jgi:fibronectin type III domain protein
MIPRTSDGAGRRSWPMFLVVALTLGTVTVAGNAQAASSHTPFGKFDSVAQSGTSLAVRGWAIDPDSHLPIKVDVHLDAKVKRVTANTSRSDVGRAHPGYGSHHGYSTTFAAVAAGSHRVCVYAIDYGLGTTNPSLGCRTITVNYSPRISISTATRVPGGFAVTGWAFDRDLPKPALAVKINYDGNTPTTLNANLARADVAKSYPSAGAAHGFAMTVHPAVGPHQLCVTAANIGLGTNGPAVCRSITLNSNPVGAFDKLTRVGGLHARVTGWAIDPDTASSASVRISVDGRAAGTFLASGSRTDIAKRYPGYGSAHGLSVQVGMNPNEHKVCVTAVNVHGGTGDASLGCRIVNAVHPHVPSTPRSVKAVGGFGSARVTWVAPTSDGGAPWSSFTVTSSRGGHSATVSAGTRAATVAGLTANAHYSFTVSARNVAGRSASGRSSIVATQANPPAQRTPAPISTSRYTRNISGSSATDLAKMRAEGAADAKHNPSGHGFMVLLDIGGQDQARHGVLLSATARFVSYTDLVRCINAYVDAYASNQKASAPVTIALGTNNDMDVSASSGAAWARSVVHPVALHAGGHSGMRIAGANDIEPGFRATYTQTKAWLSGYLGATSARFVFNGSADGCAWAATGRGCNNGWTMAGLYNLSAGASPSRIINLPQIYNNTMAAQWKYISLTGIAAHHPKINFGGALTEWTACAQAGGCGSLTGRNAWIQMWNQLQSHPSLRTGSLPYSTDLRIDR